MTGVADGDAVAEVVCVNCDRRFDHASEGAMDDFGHDLCGDCFVDYEEVKPLVAAIRAEAAADQRADVERLRIALTNIEWRDLTMVDGHPPIRRCPWCRAFQSDGHSEDCIVAAALIDGAETTYEDTMEAHALGKMSEEERVAEGRAARALARLGAIDAMASGLADGAPAAAPPEPSQ